MANKINIELNREDVQKRLKQIFLKEHGDTMSECLMDMFKDRESDLAVLFKASMGLLPEIKYEMGDEILVNSRHVSTYYADMQKSEAAGYIKDEMFTAKITSISKYAASPYHIKYYYINKDSGKEDSTHYDVSLASIKGLVEVFPGDSEKDGEGSDDLPF